MSGEVFKAIGDLFYRLKFWAIAQWFYAAARKRGAKLEWPKRG